MGLDQLPVTRASLLVRLRDGRDPRAWSEFLEIYAPVVYRFARNRGLQDADAADLMQDVLRSVSTAVGRLEYDTQRGTFRGWLFTITRNKVFSFFEKKRHRVDGSGDTGIHQSLSESPGRNDGADDWDLEYERRLAAMAMDRVRHEFQSATWQAFKLTAVDGISAKDVGEQLKMTPGAVYVAKSRVLARLKDEVQRMQEHDGARV